IEELDGLDLAVVATGRVIDHEEEVAPQKGAEGGVDTPAYRLTITHGVMAEHGAGKAGNVAPLRFTVGMFPEMSLKEVDPPTLGRDTPPVDLDEFRFRALSDFLVRHDDPPFS